jgi:hypothetical protein
VIRFTPYARARMALRNLQDQWIVRTVNAPDWSQPDPLRPGRTRSFRSITEAGGRVLRVAHQADGPDIMVITAHFDRNAKKP